MSTPWASYFPLWGILSLFFRYSIRVPVCAGCENSVKWDRRLRFILLAVLLVACLFASLQWTAENWNQDRGPLALGILLLLLLFYSIASEVIPPDIDISASKKTASIRFKHEPVAREFLRLNKVYVIKHNLEDGG